MPFVTTTNLLAASLLLRAGFFLFGLYQDAHMPVKYTDIDYLVFTDAAKYVSRGGSPYLRETYRYTPLLAWMLTPTASFYSFGKLLFVACDLLTGVLIIKILQLRRLELNSRLGLSSIWLLNPMVITISTRGSSESVLTVFIMLFVYYLLKGDVVKSAFWCGLSVHFKIYPIIYVPTALLYLSSYSRLSQIPSAIVNKKTMTFSVISGLTFLGLGYLMYSIYGHEFIEHSYIYHLSRTDHRHNFSVYNMSLYFTSSGLFDTVDLTKLAFIPQLSLSALLVPLAFTKRNLINTMFLQTFIFVTFNKVMTSQYFIWYLIFLPIYISYSKLSLKKGLICLVLWVLSQATWLYQGYLLEFEGQSVFLRLLYSSVAFFLANVYVIGVFIDDID